MEVIETPNWIPKLVRKDYTVAISLSGSAIDDPDQIFYESYVRRATTPAIATPTWRRWSTSNRWRPIRRSASGSFGRSSAKWRPTVGAAGHLPLARRDVLASLREKHHPHAERRQQQLAARGRLVGQVAARRSA
jgi:hypothetical protein